MPHPYQITKVAEIHQAEMRRDAQRQRMLESLPILEKKRYQLHKKLLIAALLLGSLSFYWLHIF